MDSQQLKANLQPFVALSQQDGHPVEIVGLDEALPGLPGNGYIVQLLAPWSASLSFGDTMDIVLEMLWQTTDVELRRQIATIRVRPNHEQREAHLRWPAKW